MNQEQGLGYLLRYLLDETAEYGGAVLPGTIPEQQRLLRALLNIRRPVPAGEEFIAVQDDYLQAETAAKGITAADSLPSAAIHPKLALWQGDITTLQAGAIVNAANSAMLGCFVPNHGCIDNAIHTYAGVQLRLACHGVMAEQGHEEPTGKAKLTEAFNLPSRYVIHTVGPIISGHLRQSDCDLLASCYRSCLELAEERDLESIAFCCISTGEFRFPQERAAEIAVQTVLEFLSVERKIEKVIFNVFKEKDRDIYRTLLGEH